MTVQRMGSISCPFRKDRARLRARRVNTVIGDAVVHHRGRHHVLVRVGRTARPDRGRIQRRGRATGLSRIARDTSAICGRELDLRAGHGGRVGRRALARRLDRVGMRRHLRDAQRDRLLPDLIADLVDRQSRRVSHAERNAPTQIRHAESRDAVAAILGSDKREQHLILIDGQQLPLTAEPAARRAREGKQHDLSDKGFHEYILSVPADPLRLTSAAGRCPGGR